MPPFARTRALHRGVWTCRALPHPRYYFCKKHLKDRKLQNDPPPSVKPYPILSLSHPVSSPHPRRRSCAPIRPRAAAPSGQWPALERLQRDTRLLCERAVMTTTASPIPQIGRHLRLGEDVVAAGRSSCATGSPCAAPPRGDKSTSLLFPSPPFLSVPSPSSCISSRFQTLALLAVHSLTASAFLSVCRAARSCELQPFSVPPFLSASLYSLLLLY
jgi:hypothetical protein